MNSAEAGEMVAANIASLLHMRLDEVRALLPQRSREDKDGGCNSSECSGTSGYGSQLGVSPPPRKDSRGTDFAFPVKSQFGAVGEGRWKGAAESGLAEIVAELEKGREKRLPKPGYLCRICFKSGHLIFDCPEKHKTECATPYKGPKQCYGEFACGTCKRKWRSGKSFANSAQECKFCRVLVFPHRQYSLEKAIEEGRWPLPKEAKKMSSF